MTIPRKDFARLDLALRTIIELCTGGNVILGHAAIQHEEEAWHEGLYGIMSGAIAVAEQVKGIVEERV